MADKKDPKGPTVTGARRRGIDTPIPIDVELTDSEVNHYRAFEIPFEVRKRWMAAKLPSLKLRSLQDPSPPSADGPAAENSKAEPGDPIADPTATAMLYSLGNVAEAPETAPLPSDSAGAEIIPPDSASEEIIPPLPRNRPRRSVVLLGAGLVVLLAVALYSLRHQDSGVSPRAAASEAAPATQATEPPSIIQNANPLPSAGPATQTGTEPSNVPSPSSVPVPPDNPQVRTSEAHVKSRATTSKIRPAPERFLPLPSAIPASSSPAPRKPDGPDFEQPFNPQ